MVLNESESGRGLYQSRTKNFLKWKSAATRKCQKLDSIERSARSYYVGTSGEETDVNLMLFVQN